MNTGRLLYIICLLTISVVGGNLKAQTIVKHQIGFDIRPGYVAPTNSFLEGDNARQKTIDQSLSLHLKYAFRFNKDSRLGRLYPHAYQGIGVSYNTFHSPAELGNPVVVYAFQGAPIVQLSPLLITSGISVLLSVGRNMTGYIIRRMRLSVLKSMHTSIWGLS